MSAALNAMPVVATEPDYELVLAPPGIDQSTKAVSTYKALLGHGKELNVVTRSRVLTRRISELLPRGTRKDAARTCHAYSIDMWRAVLTSRPEKIDTFGVDLWTFQQRLRSRYVRPLSHRHVIVVHGQQLPTEFYTVLRLLGIKGTVFIDPVQFTDDSGTSLDELVRVLDAEPPSFLPKTSDTTAPLYALLKGIDEGFFPTMPSGREGIRPVVVGHRSIDQEIRFLINHANAHRDSTIGVLLPTQELVQFFKDRIGDRFTGSTQWHLSDQLIPSDSIVTLSTPGVKVLTWSSATGMRFDHAVLAALDQVTSTQWFENSLQVLGPTAHDHLLLSYSGSGQPSVLQNLPRQLVDHDIQEVGDELWIEDEGARDNNPTFDAGGEFSPEQPQSIVELSPESQVANQPAGVSPIENENVELARRLIVSLLSAKDRRNRILTSAEEVGLAQLMHSSGDLSEDLPKGFRAGLLDYDERARAFDVMVLHNTGLVGSYVSRYLGSGLDEDDLHQHGVLGLMRAIEKWDANRGLKFSTYATHWINQAMSRAIADEGTTIRIPVHLFEIMRKVRLVRERLQKDQENVTVAQIAHIADLRNDQVVKCLRLLRGVMSLDRRYGEGKELSIADVVPAPFEHESNPDYIVDRAMLNDMVRSSVSMLKQREADVLRLRFGFDGSDDRTLEEVGEHFGFTRERARQIEAKAKNHLVPILRQVGLDASDTALNPTTARKRRTSKTVGPPRDTTARHLTGSELATGTDLGKQLGATADDASVKALLVALVNSALRSGARGVQITTTGAGTAAQLVVGHDGTSFSSQVLSRALSHNGSQSYMSAALGVAMSLYDELSAWDSYTTSSCYVLTKATQTDTWWLRSAEAAPPRLTVETAAAPWEIILLQVPRPQMAGADITTIVDRCAEELGVVFGERLAAGLEISVNGLAATSQDPFLWHNPAGQHLGEELVTAEEFSVVVSPRVLPHPNVLRDGDAVAAGSPADWQRSQGFYISCDGRYLSCGGWLGLETLDMSADTALARVLITVPPEQQSAWCPDRPGAPVEPPKPLRPRLIDLARIARRRSEIVIETHRRGMTT